MDKVKLTKRVVDAAKSKARDYRLWDAETAGFGLRVREDGGKTFVFRWWKDGRERVYSIGKANAVTVDAARAKAKELAGDVAKGNDPQRDKLNERAMIADAWTVDAMLDAFLDDRARTNKPVTVANYRLMFDADVRPRLSRKLVRDVTRTDVQRLHAAKSKDAPYQANRVLTVLSAAFTFAEDEGKLAEGANPCGVGRKRITQNRETKRRSYVTDAQYGAIGATLARARLEGLPVPGTLKAKKSGMSKARRAKLTGKTRGPYKKSDGPAPVTPANPVVVDAILFLLLSGWREQEALTLKWTDVDFAKSRAVLLDSKTGESVRVVGADALAILAARHAKAPSGPFVFPHRDVTKPIAEVRRVFECVRHAAGLPSLRVHDLRHAFAVVGSDEGFPLHVTGALLGHVQDGVTAGYATPTDGTLKRAADRIAGHIASALRGERNGAKVIPLTVTSA